MLNVGNLEVYIRNHQDNHFVALRGKACPYLCFGKIRGPYAGEVGLFAGSPETISGLGGAATETARGTQLPCAFTVPAEHSCAGKEHGVFNRFQTAWLCWQHLPQDRL